MSKTSKTSETRKLMLLYMLIPMVIQNVTNPPQITLNTAIFIWSGEVNLTETLLTTLKNAILKTTREILFGDTPHTVVALGWGFEKVSNKHREIEINNTTSFQLLTANKEKFVMIDDLLKAKESRDRKLSAIYQKTSPYEAMNILSGKSRGFDPNENVIVIS